MNAYPQLVLNVDDDDGARQDKSRILRAVGLQVDEAADGSEALRLCATRCPAVVLIDLESAADNAGLCARIKAVQAGALVLQMSDAAADSAPTGQPNVGADNYLPWPVSAALLLAQVRLLLRLHAADSLLRTSETDLDLARRSAEQRRNSFLATLAHELRNPLSPIRSAVALMERSSPTDVGVHDKARQVITRQLDQLTTLLDGMLDAARQADHQADAPAKPDSPTTAAASAAPTAASQAVSPKAPVSASPAVTSPAATNARPADTTAVPPSAGRTLLLVDDNADSTDVMGELLSALGHQVFVANDATTALALALAHRPEAIILDIGLPDIDGYTLARMLRAHPQFAKTRLIAHTGYGSPQERQQIRAAGFDVFLVKPADLGELERILSAE